MIQLADNPQKEQGTGSPAPTVVEKEKTNPLAGKDALEITRSSEFSSEPVKVQLVWTAQERTKEGEIPKVYPYLKKEDQTIERCQEIFGDKLVTQFIQDSLKREFQQLYWQRDNKTKVVTESTSEEFQKFVEHPTLSGRSVTPDSLMRKAISLMKENPTEASRLMMEAQAMLADQIAKNESKS